MKKVSDDMLKLQMRSDVNKEDTCKNEVDQDVVKIVLCVPNRRVRARRMWFVDFLILIIRYPILCDYPFVLL